jgi:hypothetical protein
MNLTLLSYNVQSRPILDNSLSKAKLIGPKLNGPELIVGLQESWVYSQQLADYTNFVNKIISTKKRHWYTLLGCGLVTLSNFTLVDQHVHIYTHAANIQDLVASKGFMMTRWLLSSGVYLTTILTHMQADYTFCPSSGPQAGMDQAIELVSYINTHVPQTDGLILYGDFNVGIFRPYDYKEYHDAGYLSNEDVERRTAIYNYIVNSLNLINIWEQFYLPPNNYDGFDLVFYRSAPNVTIVPNSIKRNNTFVDDDGVPLSDSMPVEVNITIN